MMYFLPYKENVTEGQDRLHNVVYLNGVILSDGTWKFIWNMILKSLQVYLSNIMFGFCYTCDNEHGDLK